MKDRQSQINQLIIKLNKTSIGFVPFYLTEQESDKVFKATVNAPAIKMDLIPDERHNI